MTLRKSLLDKMLACSTGRSKYCYFHVLQSLLCEEMRSPRSGLSHIEPHGRLCNPTCSYEVGSRAQTVTRPPSY
jgi:hypothetical protein